jgi:hypothetical protein
MKEALADPAKAEYHLTRFYRAASGVVVGVAGDDDFRFDLRASAATPEAAAEMAKDCEALLAEARKAADPEQAPAPADTEAAVLGFFGKAANRASVRRDGAVVTVHAEVAAGLNALIASYLKEAAAGED